jgi:anion-transporting  ArsA/GET3 family ATPase
LRQRLWIVTGKGGVGRSTLAAALALGAARRGKRTLVCELDAQERIAPLLGHAPVGPELRRVEEGLWAVNIRPAEALHEYGLMILKFEPLYRAVFENRVVHHFLRFVPSIQELVMLGKALFHVQERGRDGQPRFDVVVLDAPATGHAISLLRLPAALLATVPPGPLATEAAKMRDLLVDPATTAALIATLPEEMPLNETFELARDLRELVRMQPTSVLLNQFVEPRFEKDERRAWNEAPGATALASAHYARAQESAQAETVLGGLELPVVRVPCLYAPRLGRAELLALDGPLAPLLGAPP